MSINEKTKQAEKLIKQYSKIASDEFARCEENECLNSRHDEYLKLTQIMDVLQRMFEENHLWFTQNYLEFGEFKDIFCRIFKDLFESNKSYVSYLSGCEGGGYDWYDLCCR